MSRVDNPNGLYMVWSRGDTNVLVADMEKHVAEAIQASKQLDTPEAYRAQYELGTRHQLEHFDGRESVMVYTCKACGRVGAERYGCNCLNEPCPVIDLFSRRRVH